MHYLLIYEVAPDYLARRAQYRDAHLALAWQGTERLQPYVRLLNAFDKQYEEVLGYPAPRRSWVGGLAVRF